MEDTAAAAAQSVLLLVLHVPQRGGMETRMHHDRFPERCRVHCALLKRQRAFFLVLRVC